MDSLKPSFNANLKPKADACGEVSLGDTSPQASALGFVQVGITTSMPNQNLGYTP
jgi:hypothetical protein